MPDHSTVAVATSLPLRLGEVLRKRNNRAMLLHSSAARMVLALAAAGGLALESGSEVSRTYCARGYHLALPARWTRTLALDLGDSSDGPAAEALFTSEEGGWLRVIVDPPGPSIGADVTLRAQVRLDGRAAPEGPLPAGPRRVVAVAARTGGHEYLLLLGSGTTRDLRVPEIVAVLDGLRLDVSTAGACAP